MSFGSITDYNAIAALQESGKSGTGKLSTERSAQVKTAFDMQMKLTQNLFGEATRNRAEGGLAGSLDSSLIGDAMMFEALTAITRIMRSRSGQSQPSLQQTQNVVPQKVVTEEPTQPAVGELSARFESGSGGVATIGYDRVGGTSYGKYQIASKPGTMDRFLTFLDDKAPTMSTRLRNAGPTDTGSKSGGMPTEWKALAAENPTRFEALQHEFIANETYEPARAMILKQTGVDFNNAPKALQEVLWSTSVQHGPTGASRIFNKVMDDFTGTVGKSEFNAKLIEGVYNRRKGQFSSSTKRVQQAVSNRLNAERTLALNMLGDSQINQVV
ncbi:VgrG-related protein [Pseudodesulfovibrio piezophilus]|uniref:Type VI secretion system spike protein VgrG3-like C-terminal domain-containing protein n=1 Tax=Pseudodesulfovibrio piezophilus (strain DSM 21447 / JCM 15486 / C1TLV30) TaxID=1322246 RepID=M1WL69_PSEP2|nr:hypothetical protein [Pseudodesulfovibrio piezophilus]CCH47345.1 conserved protein of unknown function [Pseudodesulfovibrio piezophilus C1TLV30]